MSYDPDLQDALYRKLRPKPPTDWFAVLTAFVLGMITGGLFYASLRAFMG